LSIAETTVFLISLSVILLFARGFGELLRYFKQPVVMGEIIAGIILGPTILGTFFPETFNKLFNQSDTVTIALSGITLLGVVMLMLVSGLEIDLTLVIRQSRSAATISFLGVLFPFSLGFVAAYYFPEELGISELKMRLVYALFIGTALSITALPVVARTLMDLNIFKTEIGFSIITSAMINDLIGWIIFSILLGMMGVGSGHGLEFKSLIITIVIFVFVLLIILRKLIHYLLPLLEKYTSFPGGVLNFILIAGFIGAAFTEYIGIHAIFGAFIVGIAIGDSANLKEGTREIINQFVTNIFAPLFFVSIGLRINFIDNFDLSLVSIFILLSFIGKVSGSTLGAHLSGFNKYDSLTIGFGLNSHGAIEIVLGTIAFQAGLIDEKVFVALVIMALVTSISSAPIMSYFIKKGKEKSGFLSYLKTNNIIFSDAESKNEMITELCRIVSSGNKIDFQILYNEVIRREESMSTGLVNYLALPHARIVLNESIVAVGISRRGIEWDSLDKLPAKLIILLLTPKEKPEIQLQLLSEIAKKFADPGLINNLCEAKDQKDFVSKVKQLS